MDGQREKKLENHMGTGVIILGLFIWGMPINQGKDYSMLGLC